MQYKEETLDFVLSIACVVLAVCLFVPPFRYLVESMGKRLLSALGFLPVVNSHRGRKGKGASSSISKQFARIPDTFTSFEGLQNALRENGLESCNLIIGVDTTGSNVDAGRKTFHNKSLHYMPSANDVPISAKPSDEWLMHREINPYRQAIYFIGKTLAAFDEDGIIPAFYFGDMRTKAHSVEQLKVRHSEPRQSSLRSNNPEAEAEGCVGFEEVLKAYEETIPNLRFSGPTSFEPLINRAIDIVKESNDFHILLILADGQVSNIERDAAAIIRASHYPLSIVMIGVGDGPWDVMENFDDYLLEREFDNFQFVNFHEVSKSASRQPKPEVSFALNCLMETPHQYKILKSMNKIGQAPGGPHLSSMNSMNSMNSSSRNNNSNSSGRRHSGNMLGTGESGSGSAMENEVPVAVPVAL